MQQVVAEQIEAAIAEGGAQVANTSSEYKRRFRKIHSVLRAEKNSGLRHALLRGELTAQTLASMSPSQLDHYHSDEAGAEEVGTDHGEAI